METAQHESLKRLAVSRLLTGGCAAAAAEVRCPIARFRVDAAGYMDPRSRRPRLVRGGEAPRVGGEEANGSVGERGDEARTVIVECKASRADFFVDSRDAERLLRERAHLESVRAAVEERFVKVVEPHLRRSGSALFVELEEWELSRSRLPSYRKLVDELRAVDERLHGQSKFWTIAHYRLADYLYIAAPAGLIRSHELPRGWGLMELDCEGSLHIAVSAARMAGNPRHRTRLLRNIAVAACRGKSGGVSGWRGDGERPETAADERR